MTEMFCIRVVQVIFAFIFYYYYCFISLSVNTHIVVKYLNRKLNHITCIYFLPFRKSSEMKRIWRQLRTQF